MAVAFSACGGDNGSSADEEDISSTSEEVVSSDSKATSSESAVKSSASVASSESKAEEKSSESKAEEKSSASEGSSESKTESSASEGSSSSGTQNFVMSASTGLVEFFPGNFYDKFIVSVSGLTDCEFDVNSEVRIYCSSSNAKECYTEGVAGVSGTATVSLKSAKVKATGEPLDESKFPKPVEVEFYKSSDDESSNSSADEQFVISASSTEYVMGDEAVFKVAGLKDCEFSSEPLYLTSTSSVNEKDGCSYSVNLYLFMDENSITVSLQSAKLMSTGEPIDEENLPKPVTVSVKEK